MKKLILSCFLSALCLTTAFAVDYSGTCGENLTWELTDSVLTISGTGTMNDYANGSPWYMYRESIGQVILNEGITSIGTSAFMYCTSLTSVVIPHSVISIGDYAFCYCTGMLTMTIPDNVTSIGFSCFRQCDELSQVIIGNGVTDLGSSTFSLCKKLKSVKLGNNIQVLKELVFQECFSIDSIDIPNGVSSIQTTAFLDCSKLKKVNIGTGMNTIGMSAFYHCYNLKEIKIDAVNPPSLNYSFWETGLEKVYVPCNSVAAYENSSWSSYTIIGIGGDCDTQPEPENSKIWNISDAAFNSLGSITSKKTIDGLTIYATENKPVVIDADAREVDGLSFTHRLKFGGTGASDARTLSFKVDGECDIDVYLMSASGSTDRTLNVDKGSFGTTLQQIPAYSSGISKGTVHYTGGATTIYLYSPSSGVNIYAIRVTSENAPQSTTYTVSVSSANTSMGTVSGGGTYEEGATATITATPKSGYKFTKWSNGSTANPYTFTVTSDVSLTAYFEQSSTPQPESSTFWNFSDAAFSSLGTITSTKTVQGLTLCATSDKNMVVDESTQEIDGISFTHRLKLNGTGDASYRSLKFNVTGDCIIDIYAKSGSSSADRLLNIDKGSFGNTYAQASAYGSAISKATVQYTGGATTIYVYSSSSGINLYGIRVTYKTTEDIENTVVRTHAQKILRNGQIFILRDDKTYTLQGQEVK